MWCQSFPLNNIPIYKQRGWLGGWRTYRRSWASRRWSQNCQDSASRSLFCLFPHSPPAVWQFLILKGVARVVAVTRTSSGGNLRGIQSQELVRAPARLSALSLPPWSWCSLPHCFQEQSFVSLVYLWICHLEWRYPKNTCWINLVHYYLSQKVIRESDLVVVNVVSLHEGEYDSECFDGFTEINKLPILVPALIALGP